MQAMHCPICFTPLEIREVAPCYDCGHMDRELAELAEGRHTYSEYRIFGLPVVLCDFCDADFGSYKPGYLGLPDHERLAPNCLEFVREVDPTSQAHHDKYCPLCRHRLAFLQFLAEVRARRADP